MRKELQLHIKEQAEYYDRAKECGNMSIVKDRIWELSEMSGFTSSFLIDVYNKCIGWEEFMHKFFKMQDECEEEEEVEIEYIEHPHCDFWLV